MELVCWKIVGLVRLKSGNHFFFNAIVCQPYYLEYFLPPLERNLDHFQVLKIVSLDNCLKRQSGTSCPSEGPFQDDAIPGPCHGFHMWPREAQRFVQPPVGCGGLSLQPFQPTLLRGELGTNHSVPLNFMETYGNIFQCFFKSEFPFSGGNEQWRSTGTSFKSSSQHCAPSRKLTFFHVCLRWVMTRGESPSRVLVWTKQVTGICSWN